MSKDLQFFAQDDLQKLINTVLAQGYECIGPQVRDGTIIYDTLTSVEQLPRGVSDLQSAGSYTLENSSRSKYFDWANGPQAIKPLLFTPREELWKSKRSDAGHITFSSAPVDSKPKAIIAARACDIAAMQLQDQHFLQQQFVDSGYKTRRENLLTIAVNCGHPAQTCFCHSTGDGPFIEKAVEQDTDIVLTELEHGFLIKAHTTAGKKLLSLLSLQKASPAQKEEFQQIKANSARQTRALPDGDIKNSLSNAMDDSAWEKIATECLSCGNCTSVCPTCFCHSENELSSVDGNSSSHYREWDSCFTQGHSYIHGITIRPDTSQRYRQWLSHKFSSWIDQYGRSGCVGCGRCISWCPVGIDVLESINQIIEKADV